MPIRILISKFKFVFFITFYLINQKIHAEGLCDIYKSGIQDNIDFRLSESRFRAEVEIKNQAASNLKPKISIIGNYSTNNRTQEIHELSTSGQSVVNNKQHREASYKDNFFELNLSQDIFNLPSWFRFKSGEALEKRAQDQYQVDQQDLAFLFAFSYMNAARALETFQILTAASEEYKKQWLHNQKMNQLGLTGTSDVDLAQAQYETSHAEVLTAEQNLMKAKAQLHLVAGKDYKNIHLASKDFPISNTLSADHWVQQALSNSYSLKIKKSTLDSTYQDLLAVRSERLPKISTNLRYQRRSLSGHQQSDPESPFSVFPDARTDIKMATIEMVIPIYSGGYVNSQSKQAYELYNMALDEKIKVEREIASTIRTQYGAIELDIQRIAAYSTAKGAAKKSLKATKTGYEIGVKNITDILQGQKIYFTSLREESNSRYDYIINSMSLRYSAGLLNSEYLCDMDNLLTDTAPQP